MYVIPETLHAVDLLAFANNLDLKVKTARERIVSALRELTKASTAEDVRASTIDNIAHDIAEMEGRAEVYERASVILRNSVEHEATIGYALAYLGMRTAEMLISPDDRWSGRGNDLKRSKHDGRTEAVRDITLRLNVWLNPR